jgi:hypothetical protein
LKNENLKHLINPKNYKEEITMLKKEKVLMFAAIGLVILAFVFCYPEYIVNLNHDYQPGLSSWKRTEGSEVKHEAKYKYNQNGDITAIEIYVKGRPYGTWSFLDYVNVKDNATGENIKYRVCTRRVHFNETTHLKDWEDSTIVVVIGDFPKIKTLITKDGKGKYNYIDRYEYDDAGRKTKATRTTYTTSGQKTITEEYTYEDSNNIGVVPETYYFKIPYVYYNISDYIFWCTEATKSFSLE